MGAVFVSIMMNVYFLTQPNTPIAVTVESPCPSEDLDEIALSPAERACPSARPWGSWDAGGIMGCKGPGKAENCECDDRPLGAGTADMVSKYYPYGNSSLASIYHTAGFLKNKLLPLDTFKAKAILIANTASN